MPELPILLQQLVRIWSPEVWRDVTVLVAVSGGPDSVALLCGLAALRLQGNGQLIAAHFNHGLRGEQSEADALFVVDLCRRLGISCELGRADRADEMHGGQDGGGERVGGGRSEAQLRAVRYQFLSATARRVGARYVATGHTADDQAETVLLRVLRGTGIVGLAGIRGHRQLMPGVSLVRPLLNVSRGQTREYLECLGQCYRQDSSNSDLRYTRNRIRHELLPHLAEQYNAGIVDALTRLAVLAKDVHDVVAGLLGDIQRRCVTTVSPLQVTVDCRELAGESRYLVRELLIAVWQQQDWPLQEMGYERWEQLADLACSAEPPSTDWKRIFPGSISAERDGPWLRLLASPAPPVKSFS